MRLLNYLNKTIEYSFYLLLFIVPLTLTGDTSELFEFNKLWATFILSIVIGIAWISKMIINRKIEIQRTPLDIPIGLFVLSQAVSTIFSMDMHTSLWGYYSRFNGGLFSILSYVFLYYAFVSNFKDFSANKTENPLTPKRILIFIAAILVFFAGNYLSSLFVKIQSANLLPIQMLISTSASVIAFIIFMIAAPVGGLKKTFYAVLSSSLLVILWGLPSHFGFDPTCLLFRGTLDVACWTADFQPRIRAFSTLGQPDWLGTYLVALIPLSIAIFINFIKEKDLWQKGLGLFKNLNALFAGSLLLFIAASYLLLLYTLSRSAVASAWISLVILGAYFIWFYVLPKLNIKKPSFDFKLVAILAVLLFAVTFFSTQPFSFLDIFTLKGINAKIVSLTAKPSEKPKESPKPQAPAFSTGELGGTDSGIIRKYVWQGALEIWKHYPLFGSGVETYAFSYYKFKPIGHNLTSEWNFLYNKAHNEYLNYLATTGTFGIATYLFMIGFFLFLSIKLLLKNSKKFDPNTLLIAALLSGYIGILVSNFFGFSVVYVNILFFLIPAFVFVLAKLLPGKTFLLSFTKDKVNYQITSFQKGIIIFTALVGLYLIFVLIRFWQADRYYYYGSNLDRSQDFQRGYSYLKEAVNLRPSEPTFRDEFSVNNAVLAYQLIYQNQQKPDQQNLNLAKQLIADSISQGNRIQLEHPNNIVFAKSRVRIYYTLAQVDPSYLPAALDAIKKAQVLAPTDADVSYNLGVLLGQTGDANGAIKELKNTIVLKPDYQNAYYALGIFYHQLALDKNGKVANRDYLVKAIDQMKLLVKNFGANPQAQAAIDTWSKE